MFNDWNPVFSVSCSSETFLDHFFATQVFERKGFRFIEGPLIQAAKEGCVFLADEFNLLPTNVMISLLPFLEARAGDIINHPEVLIPVKISCVFLFFGTENKDTERGRIKLPEFVSSQFCILNARNPSSKNIESLIEQIIEADYPKVKEIKVLPKSTRIFNRFAGRP